MQAKGKQFDMQEYLTYGPIHTTYEKMNQYDANSEDAYESFE